MCEVPPLKGEISIEHGGGVVVNQRSHEEYQTVLQMGNPRVYFVKSIIAQHRVSKIEQQPKKKAGEDAIGKFFPLRARQKKDDQKRKLENDDGCKDVDD